MGNIGIFNFLLNKGIDTTIRNKDGLSAKEIATSAGQYLIILTI